MSKNRGVACCRHEAILRSNGNYITTLDSDDYFFDNCKLKKEIELIKKFKKNTGKNIIAFSNTVAVAEDRKLIQKYGDIRTIKQGDILEDVITRSCLIPRDFVMLKSQYFMAGGYDPSFHIYEDWDLKIRLCCRYEFYYTENDGTAYRHHGKGLSSADSAQHIKALKEIFKKNSVLLNPSKSSIIEDKFNSYIKNIENN